MRSMGESLTQYIKKKGGGANNNEDKHGQGRRARSEVGEQQARQPPARTQALSTSSLTPNTKNIKERGCSLLSHLVNGGVRYGAVVCFPHSWLLIRGFSPRGPPQVPPQATPSVSFPHKQGLGHDKRRGVLQLLEEGLSPFSEGVRRAWGPENTFMWQRQGAGAFSVTPRLSPEMAAVGVSPSAGLSSEPS